MAKAIAENSKLAIAHNYKVRSANFTASQIATMVSISCQLGNFKLTMCLAESESAEKND